jgi:hypothetical protein
MLYKIRQDQSVKELNPELDSIPEFADLTDRQMVYVIFVADRRSPLKTLPDKAKKEKATQLAGWGMEGTRPDKNARTVISGGVPAIEKAILKYRELQWDENQDTLDTINAQIQEIKDYMKSDKSIPLVVKDKVVLDSAGKEIRMTNPKNLEIAAKLGEKLPSLIEAKQKLESILQISQDQKPEITTYSSLDLPEVEGEENVSTIDLFWQNQSKNEENN